MFDHPSLSQYVNLVCEFYFYFGARQKYVPNSYNNNTTEVYIKPQDKIKKISGIGYVLLYRIPP